MTKKAGGSEKKTGEKKTPTAKSSSGKAKKQDEEPGDKGKARVLPVNIDY